MMARSGSPLAIYTTCVASFTNTIQPTSHEELKRML
jgi:hypothetical protein